MAGNTNIVVSRFRALGQAKYPFTDRSTLTAVDGWTLPADLVVDAILYPPGGGARQYLAKLTIQAGVLSVVFADSLKELCRGSLAVTDSRQVILRDDYQRPCGVLVLGEAFRSLNSGLLDGEHSFRLPDAELVPSVTVPQPQVRVEGLVTREGDFVSGEVWLVGRTGVVLEQIPHENAVRVHVVGDPLFKRRQCTADGTPYFPPPPLRELRIVADDAGYRTFRLVPDARGNVRITTGSNQAVDNVMRVTPVPNGLKLSLLGNRTTS